MTDENGPEKPETPGMSEVSTAFVHEAAGKAAPTSEREFLSSLGKSAEAGDETAKRMIEQADSWREMPFVREENGNAVIEWPRLAKRGAV